MVAARESLCLSLAVTTRLSTGPYTGVASPMFSSRNYLLTLLAASLPGIFVSGCGPRADNESPALVRTVGYSAMSLTNPFFQEIADTLKEEGRQYNMVFEVNDADNKADVQTKQIENYIASGMDAIVINPVDRTALGPAIKKANEAGIPVFTCDLQCTAKGVKIAAHIGTDNLQGGRLAGDAMVEAIGDQGGQVLVLHFKQANSCVLRVDGFVEVIKKHNEENPDRKIDIVAELEGGGSRDVAVKAMADALQANPDLTGVFAINDPSALGAWRAINDVGKTDQITIIGFDGAKKGKIAIREGKIYADPIQFPKRMARETVTNIITYINGDEVPAVTLIPTKLYRKADAEADPELKPQAKDE